MPVATSLEDRFGKDGDVAEVACKVVLVRDGVEEDIRYYNIQETFKDH